MRTLKQNKAQLAFIAEHPEMSRDYQEQEEAKKQDQCQCKEPQYALSTPSMKTDGTYFSYCKRCEKFRDVPKPISRELVF
jgi:hypothetical protein